MADETPNKPRPLPKLGMLPKPKPQGLRVVRTELSALTRMQWTGLVVVDETVTEGDLHDLTGMVYEYVDGGDYTEDSSFWEKGQACQSEFLAAADEEAGKKPNLVAYKDDDESLVLRELPQGEAPARFLRLLRATGGDAERIGRVEKARELFDAVNDLDGHGIAGTDDDLLAKTIAEKFDVSPKEVYDGYTGSDEDDEDEA